jgi:drug/metabolite transporter (DMT)-like permease
MELSSHRRGQAYVAAAAVAWSTAGVLQRGLTMSTATQASGRAFFAFFGLLGFVFLRERRGTLAAFRRMLGLAGIGVAVFTAISSGCFIVALNQTSVANVLVLQAISPLFAALIARVALGERIGRRTGFAMAIAFVGVGVMVGGPGATTGLGLALTLVMSLTYAVALVITRHRRDISMAPALCMAQSLVFLVALPFAQPAEIGPHDVLLLATLGIGQMALGLALLSVGARLIPASEVALISLLEVVLGPIWVFLARGERPTTATLVGGAVVLAGVALQASEAPQPVEVDGEPVLGEVPL